MSQISFETDEEGRAGEEGRQAFVVLLPAGDLQVLWQVGVRKLQDFILLTVQNLHKRGTAYVRRLRIDGGSDNMTKRRRT